MENRSPLTVADSITLLANGIDSERDHFPAVKLFTPDGPGIWLLTEADPDDPDRLFGLCDLGLGFPELGYVILQELVEVRGRLGLPVERDNHFVADRPLSAYTDEARVKGRIVA